MGITFRVTTKAKTPNNAPKGAGIYNAHFKTRSDAQRAFNVAREKLHTEYYRVELWISDPYGDWRIIQVADVSMTR